MDRERCYSRSTICKQVKQVYKRQKEAIMQSSSCVGCDGLVKVVGNTIPLAFYMCDGSLFEAIVKPHHHHRKEPKSTFLFRVEEIYDDCTIKCRLIDKEKCFGRLYEEENHHHDDLDCLDQTVIIDLNCVCGLQCFDPIYCRPCRKH